MGTIYKTTKEIFKGDSYIGVFNQSLETPECLYLIQDYCQTKALIHTSF